MSSQTLVSVRNTGSDKAVVLIHGYSGDSHTTFGMLPAFLAGDPKLHDWDIHCFGYPTSLAPDISGIWAADPDLSVLSGFLITAVDQAHFPRYQKLVFVAHSMGGLILQRALLDGNFFQRVRKVLLFGTPSNGLRKSLLGFLFKRQVRDMLWGGSFIASLRSDWTKRFGAQAPFEFRAIAGIRDEFVPVASSVEPFDAKYRSYVAGNHLEMVKPKTAETDSAVLVRSALTGAPAALAQATDFQRQVQALWPKRKKATEKDIVKLALALEMTGAQDRAITLLRETRGKSTELTGVLGGRLKRVWLADPDGQPDAGIEAYELYRQAYQSAVAKKDAVQAYYNGINYAFMTLALKSSREEARRIAQDVLTHCMLAPRDKWRLATEGEAQIYLGDHNLALTKYSAALDEEPDAREKDSMHRQALWASRLLQDDIMELKINAVFAS